MKIARCHKDAFLIVGLNAALLACTPTAPPSAGSETFQPNPGAGAIYVVRGLDPVFLGGASVTLDGQALPSLMRSDYARVDVSPGDHRIACGEANTVVRADSGGTTFVEVLLQVGALESRCLLRLLDEPSGRQRVAAGKRV
ncbi:MAG TPA: hypothetical protein VJR58_17625 [Vineibacter sp.]|nr:hypothetical protein [Vineibacter sp.]